MARSSSARWPVSSRWRRRRASRPPCSPAAWTAAASSCAPRRSPPSRVPTRGCRAWRPASRPRCWRIPSSSRARARKTRRSCRPSPAWSQRAALKAYAAPPYRAEGASPSRPWTEPVVRPAPPSSLCSYSSWASPTCRMPPDAGAARRSSLLPAMSSRARRIPAGRLIRLRLLRRCRALPGCGHPSRATTSPVLTISANPAPSAVTVFASTTSCVTARPSASSRSGPSTASAAKRTS